MAELIEVVTSAGESTGAIKTRDAVHRDGDWHRAAFIWVFDDRRRILFQRRSLDKDAWPGRWDASSAGHVEAGEAPIDCAVRELREELGLETTTEALAPHGHHREEHHHPNGTVDREYQIVFLLGPIDPSKLSPGPEVIALAFAEPSEVVLLARGADVLNASLARERTKDERPLAISRGDLVPYEEDYLLRVAERVAQVSF